MILDCLNELLFLSQLKWVAALIEAKALCKHGEWLGWLKSNCRVSERTTQIYMKLANEYPLLEDSNTQRVADLSIRDAVKLLSTPKEVALIVADNSWMPTGEQLAIATLEGMETLYLQESVHQGFYFVVCIGDAINYTTKAIPVDHVEKFIFECLPSKYVMRDCKIKHLDWEYLDSETGFVENDLISGFLSDDSKHLKKSDEGFGKSTSEIKKLETLERIMEKNLNAQWRANGLMLKEIRDGQMYKISHDSFDAYLQDRFDLTEAEANNMIVKATFL